MGSPSHNACPLGIYRWTMRLSAALQATLLPTTQALMEVVDAGGTMLAVEPTPLASTTLFWSRS